MAYKDSLRISDEGLFQAMQVAAKTGAVVMVHAENGDAIEVLVADAIAAGNTDPIYHALTRPPETEGEATNRAVQLAHIAGAPLYVVHVSCEESLEPIQTARRKGWNVWGETCTQYFFVDTTYLERLEDFEGGNYVYTPPPRPKKNQEILWNAVRTNDLQVISTDHCAYTREQKALGKDDFRQIPNGAVGMENRLQMIHHFGVRQGRITLNRMVELLCTNPAKLFGMYPKKGTIAVGCDADIVVFDPEKQHTISAKTPPLSVRQQHLRGHRSLGAPETCCCAATCSWTAGSSSRLPASGSTSPGRASARSSPAPAAQSPPRPGARPMRRPPSGRTACPRSAATRQARRVVDIALRYGRSVVIALKASVQHTIRAIRGIASPAMRSG